MQDIILVCTNSTCITSAESKLAGSSVSGLRETLLHECVLACSQHALILMCSRRVSHICRTSFNISEDTRTLFKHYENYVIICDDVVACVSSMTSRRHSAANFDLDLNEL